MNKLGTIIKKEYLTRVKTKTFIVLTFLTPALFILIFLIPVWISSKNHIESVTFGIIDNSSELKNAFVSTKDIHFEFIENQLDTTKDIFEYNNYDAIVFIPKDFHKDTISVFSKKQIS